jgi:hypothetical protein
MICQNFLLLTFYRTERNFTLIEHPQTKEVYHILRVAFFTLEIIINNFRELSLNLLFERKKNSSSNNERNNVKDLFFRLRDSQKESYILILEVTA